MSYRGPKYPDDRVVNAKGQSVGGYVDFWGCEGLSGLKGADTTKVYGDTGGKELDWFVRTHRTRYGTHMAYKYWSRRKCPHMVVRKEVLDAPPQRMKRPDPTPEELYDKKGSWSYDFDRADRFDACGFWRKNKVNFRRWYAIQEKRWAKLARKRRRRS